MPMFSPIIAIRSAWLGNAPRPWQSFLWVLLALNLPFPLYAASFTIVDGQVVTTQQTLNANETGVIEAGGTLSTTGAGTHAINNPGGQDNISVDNRGNITTSGDNTLGIFSSGANAAITSSGSITSTGNNSDGIGTAGANAKITHSGNITSARYGIQSSGADAVITNTGSITTTGNIALGIVLFSGSNATITHSGNITTSGTNSDGIASLAANTKITISGSIMTSGNNADGIFATGVDAVITNSGNISTTGTGAEGILSTGDDAVITNSGAISTTGDGAIGILSTGDDAVITNSGAISTKGLSAHGISSGGANAVITSSGSLSTTGEDADGISATGANAVITNSGNIQVSGNNSIGVSLDSGGADDNTLTNSGSIIASGSATQAIAGGTGSNTVNLQTGSKIIGSINLGAGADAFNVLGLPLASSHMTLQNVETITLAAGLPGVVNGNTVTTVDPSMQTVQGTALSTLTSAFHNVISQRLAQTEPLGPVQLASLELSPGMLFQERAPVVWGEVFGSHRSRGNDGLALAYYHDYAGFTGGYERDFHNARVGLFAGFATADAETDVTSIQTDTDSFFGGGYAHFYLGPVNLTTSLAVGVEDHENDRTVIDNLAGIETARSDFNSVFFSPSLTLSSAYTLNETFEFRPSASLTYYVAWYDSYTESGTTRSNLSIDDRTDHALVGRLQLALAMALTDTTELELRIGVISRHTDQDDINASLAGASFQYAAAGDDSVYGGLVGGTVRVNVTDRLDLMGDAEIINASGDESDISARLRVEYRF